MDFCPVFKTKYPTVHREQNFNEMKDLFLPRTFLNGSCIVQPMNVQNCVGKDPPTRVTGFQASYVQNIYSAPPFTNGRIFSAIKPPTKEVPCTYSLNYDLSNPQVELNTPVTMKYILDNVGVLNHQLHASIGFFKKQTNQISVIFSFDFQLNAMYFEMQPISMHAGQYISLEKQRDSFFSMICFCHLM